MKETTHLFWRFRLLYKSTDGFIEVTIGYADYKSLSGNIHGYKHKFKLDKKYSVLSKEELSDSTLLIRLGKIDDHHKK